MPGDRRDPGGRLRGRLSHRARRRHPLHRTRMRASPSWRSPGGSCPDLSGTQALRRLVPLDVAKKLIFSGEPISGARAVELHLGTETSERPLEAAFALARTIATRSPEAIRAAKQVLNASGLVPLAEGLANEFQASSSLMGGKNQIEAVMAKLEKRPPRFADPEAA